MALEILTYLAQRPEAQDTLDGILQWWWVVEPQRPRHPREVRAAVDQLLAAGFVLSARGRDRQERYRLDPARLDAARELVALRRRRDQ
jgi:hypothetical protein